MAALAKAIRGLLAYTLWADGEILDAEFRWRSVSGESRAAPLRQVLLHFANHATYHRGQVVSQLRQLGRAAPSTDLVYWKGAL